MKAKTVVIIIIFIIVVIIAIIIFRKKKEGEDIPPGGTVNYTPPNTFTSSPGAGAGAGFYTTDQARFWLNQFHRSTGKEGDYNYAVFSTPEGDKKLNLDLLTPTVDNLSYSNYLRITGRSAGYNWIINFYLPNITAPYVSYILYSNGQFTRTDYNAKGR